MKFSLKHWALIAVLVALCVGFVAAKADDDIINMEDDVDDFDVGDAGKPGDSPVDNQQKDKPAVIDPPDQKASDANAYSAPKASGALFFDDFQDGLKKWTHSEVSMYAGQFAVGQGESPVFPGDRGLIIPQKARHYALSAPVVGAEDLTVSDLVVQYEVKFSDGMTCGGAYVKLPTDGFPGSKKFDSSVKYSVMFGPDKCGSTDKVHFIFQSKNPKTGELKEHHLSNPPTVASSFDKSTHLYSLYVQSNGSFSVLIDGEVKRSGSLADDFEPPVQPPKEISDKDDKKPTDWVDEKQVPDPDAKKPEDWDDDAPEEIPDESVKKPEGWLDDEPLQVRDPAAVKPSEWDDEEDGEWLAPMVSNPKCEKAGCGEWKRPTVVNPKFRGKWTPPLIDNPKYIGEWSPRKIPNPEYYEVNKIAMLPIKAVGFEIWTMDQGVLFDNVWIGKDIKAAEQYRDVTFSKKKVKEDEASKKAAMEQDKNSKNNAAKSTAEKILRQVDGLLNTLESNLRPIEDMIVKVGAEPVLDKLIDLGVAKPLLTVVSFPLLVVALMLALFSGSGKKSVRQAGESNGSEDRKKTDAVTPDDTEPSSTTDEVQATSDDISAGERTVRNRRRVPKD